MGNFFFTVCFGLCSSSFFSPARSALCSLLFFLAGSLGFVDQLFLLFLSFSELSALCQFLFLLAGSSKRVPIPCVASEILWMDEHMKPTLKPWLNTCFLVAGESNS